jgi:transcriptional regulator with XRE-family HTH domain
LSQYRKSKGLSQEQFGKKLGLSQATYQTYESGRSAIPPEIQAKIRKLGFVDRFPQEEGQDTPAPAGPALTREEFAEWRGYWKKGTEELLQRLEDLTRRVDQLEKRSS